MNKESITPEVSKRICKHMNKDHESSLLNYAKHYAGIENPVKAEMLEISAKAMHLRVDGQEIKIKFDHYLNDANDAHRTLVDMQKNIPLKNP